MCVRLQYSCVSAVNQLCITVCVCVSVCVCVCGCLLIACLCVCVCVSPGTTSCIVCSSVPGR